MSPPFHNPATPLYSHSSIKKWQNRRWEYEGVSSPTMCSSYCIQKDVIVPETGKRNAMQIQDNKAELSEQIWPVL